MFVKEGQGLAKRGAELIKMNKQSTEFVLVNSTDPIRLMFEACWSAMLAVLSMLLEENDDKKIVLLCIKGFINSIKICG